MINISVKLDIAQLRRDLAKEQRKVPQAASRALNRAIDAARTVCPRISAATKIKQADIRNRMRVIGANVNYLIAELEALPFSP